MAFLTPWDVTDENSWSGVVAPMFDSLQRRADVEALVTADVPDAFPDRVAAGLIGRLTRKKYLVGHALSTAKARARYVDQVLAGSNADIILAVAASQDVAFLKDRRPVIQITDATLAAIVDFYPLFSDLHAASRRQAQTMARRAQSRTKAFAVASEWAAASLVRDYGIAREAVAVAPFGPGIQPGPTTTRSSAANLRVLAVTSDWVRKGGADALEAVARLRSRGIPATLTVVGDAPPDLPEWVGPRGRVPRAGMAEVYREHDVLIEMATANAGGVTMTDAHAFGLPVVATNVGGVGSIVENGSSGILLAPGPDCAAQAADALAALADPDFLRRFRTASLERHRTVLNWDAWAESVLRLAYQVRG